MFTKLKQLFYILLLFVFYTNSCNTKSSVNSETNRKGIRIVSLAQSISKELSDLGMDSSIVGATSFCDISKNKKELIIGTSTEVNIEKILLLKPDIVFATGLTSQATISSLKNNGIQVFQLPKMDSYQEICENFRVIGKMVGKKELADSIIHVSLHVLDSLKSLIPTQSAKPKVFFQIGANPIFTVIPNTYMNDFISFAGCENIAYDLKSGTMTRESILQRNPDVIIVASMGIASEKEVEVWNTYKGLNAAKNHRIFVIDSNISCTPTVTTFTKAFEQIIKMIYQEN